MHQVNLESQAHISQVIRRQFNYRGLERPQSHAQQFMLSFSAVIRSELINAAEPKASARGLTAPETPLPGALGEGPGRFALQGSTARTRAGTGAPSNTRC